MGDLPGRLLCSRCFVSQRFHCKTSSFFFQQPYVCWLARIFMVSFMLHCVSTTMKVLGKVIDIRLKSPGWIKSLEEEMSVERICGSIPTSASSTLLAEDADMGDDDYDMEGKCNSNYLKKLGGVT